MKKNFIFLLYLFFFSNCFFFRPYKINSLEILIPEKDLVGEFKGIRFFFNRFNENQGFSEVYKKCQLKTNNQIFCEETYNLHNRNIKQNYCLLFEYQSSTEIYLKFFSHCLENKNYLQNLYTEEKIRGGGFMLYSWERDPNNSHKIYLSSFYFSKGNGNFFYEEKKYFLIIFLIGKEITIWEKLQ